MPQNPEVLGIKQFQPIPPSCKIGLQKPQPRCLTPKNILLCLSPSETWVRFWQNVFFLITLGLIHQLSSSNVLLLFSFEELSKVLKNKNRLLSRSLMLWTSFSSLRFIFFPFTSFFTFLQLFIVFTASGEGDDTIHSTWPFLISFQSFLFNPCLFHLTVVSLHPYWFLIYLCSCFIGIMSSWVLLNFQESFFLFRNKWFDSAWWGAYCHWNLLDKLAVYNRFYQMHLFFSIFLMTYLLKYSSCTMSC